ncbi:MAG: glycosyltransferase family 1 protein [Planctomycetota bacterium]
MRFALITDAWEPQVNGVVRTWQQVTSEMTESGHEPHVIHPALFRAISAPRYPEIKLAILPGRRVRARLDELKPDAIHIATEGPLGQAARKYCKKRKLPYTTSYHTQFPHYLRKYFGIPSSLSYRFIRWFHGSAKHTLVPTKQVGEELKREGLDNIVVWSRGVDTKLFHPNYDTPPAMTELPRPIFVYAGRVAIEKNIEAFLELDLPGSKVVIGDGPPREGFEKKYPDTHFVGYKFGEDLAAHYAAGDVFVFPSKTDTFGVVMLEANACGLPIAAYPVTGPIDVVQQGSTGFVYTDLREAAVEALQLKSEDCIGFAQRNSWGRCAQTVVDHLAIIERGPSATQATASEPPETDPTGVAA